MTDLNKERSEFEALPLIKEKLNAVYFDGTLNSYFSAMINSSPTVKYVQGAWMAWQEKAKAQAVPDSSYGVILTCEQLREALEFGAPDLKIETNEFSDEQMGTELAIIYQENGHSGEGFYSYYVECPDEGSIKLGESESGAEG